ncbi:MAG: hypothetical protein IKL49_10925 [Lachnospiraceae bacterium]|nr:hypothetical protein [Lachnospiraceae bacterium]
MDKIDFLYLIKSIEDNKVQLVTRVDIIEGEVRYKGKICTVLKRYIFPVDILEMSADIGKFSVTVPFHEKQFDKKLTDKSRSESVTDHKGNSYRNVKEMCENYGIKPATFRARMRNGFTREEALTTAIGKLRKKQVVDHLGNTYSTIKEMCSAYAVNNSTYLCRIRKGYTVEEALTGKRKKMITQISSNKKKKKFEVKDISYSSKKNSKATSKEKKFLCFDHKSNGYHSQAEMCKAYEISLSTFKRRQAEGLSLQESLELPVTKGHSFTFKDHMGTKYENLKEMCTAWNISVHSYQRRISQGYSRERALTEPDDFISITDHKGNSFPTIQSMCAAYGISTALYTTRIKRGKSISEALETPIEDNSVEYNGKTYASMKDLAKEHNISVGTLKSRLKYGWSLEEAVSGVKVKNM